MKVLVIGDATSTNLGDPVLTHSAAYLVKKIVASEQLGYEVEEFSIVERIPSNFHQSKNVAQTSPIKEKRILAIGNLFSKLKVIINWLIRDRKSFLSRLEKQISCDQKTIFVIAGGAMISNSWVYALRLNEIVSYAEKSGGKVVFNSVGIEKTIAKSVTRFFYRKMLKKNAVVAFSTRDNSDEVKKLTNRKQFYKQTADPGVFCSEAYGVAKKTQEIVGIGVISTQAYHSISKINKKAKEISEDTLIEFWHNLIVELEKKHIKWKIFSNGGPKDYLMACKLIEKYNYPKEKLLELPLSPEQLVLQISGFSAIVAHRLHALIIATSLNIPVIPVVWSNKVQKFAELIKISNLAVWPDVNIVPKISEMLSDKDFKTNETAIKQLKTQAYEYIKDSINCSNSK